MKRHPTPSAIWTPILAKRLTMLEGTDQNAGKRHLAHHFISRAITVRAMKCRMNRAGNLCPCCGAVL